MRRQLREGSEGRLRGNTCIEGKEGSMVRTALFLAVLGMFLGSGAMEAQPAAAAAGAGQGPTPAQQAQIDAKLQEALRERDAIIRNLLERVSELEWRVNGGFTTAAKADEKPPLPGAVNSRVINSVVSTSTYGTTERQAAQALDQALIVHGGLLLPSGTMEIDNTTSYYSASS